ncbi:MAG TPA: SGNH/GDSL hydrolase family protein [Bacteroidota bacterium]|nr:SGNH/GDSL hydrolase family protein [Bacteroidota bacterium]
MNTHNINFQSIRKTLWIAALLGISACASNLVRVQKGERIIFLGDSITHAGVKPDGFVTLISDTLSIKHPGWGIEVIGAGVSGNRVPDLQQRLDRDVLEKHPTLVFIYIGINDVWHWKENRGTTKEQYESGLKDIIEKIQKGGARVILCTPSVIGEKKNHGNAQDGMLEEYVSISRRVAKEMDCQLCDLHKAFVEYLSANNPEDKEKGVLTVDGVHLNPEGNRFVANLMLAALGE